jgi:SpoVK/Ycf46/Vps4 family AAA+-type ATPase
VLLYGPPGTGKTLLARAVAGASGARFLPLPIPAILRAGVGDSERALTAAFAAAAASAPCLLFLDELQALFPARGSGDEEEERMAGMLSAVFIQCLDGLAARPASEPPVRVLAATNAPWALDAALLTSSRLATTVYVGLPSAADRADVLRPCLSRMPIEGGEALAVYLAGRTPRYSGADLANLCRSAAAEAVALTPVGAHPTLTLACFEAALGRGGASVEEGAERGARQSRAALHRDLQRGLVEGAAGGLGWVGVGVCECG